jgi:hypothetical protein
MERVRSPSTRSRPPAADASPRRSLTSRPRSIGRGGARWLAQRRPPVAGRRGRRSGKSGHPRTLRRPVASVTLWVFFAPPLSVFRTAVARRRFHAISGMVRGLGPLGAPAPEESIPSSSICQPPWSFRTWMATAAREVRCVHRVEAGDTLARVAGTMSRVAPRRVPNITPNSKATAARASKV